MRISDWSSDVCSSDLLVDLPGIAQVAGKRARAAGKVAVALGLRLLQHRLAPSADDEACAQRPHAAAHRLAAAGAAARDADALFLQEVARGPGKVARHTAPTGVTTAPAALWPWCHRRKKE